MGEGWYFGTNIGPKGRAKGLVQGWYSDTNICAKEGLRGLSPPTCQLSGMPCATRTDPLTIEGASVVAPRTDWIVPHRLG